MDRANWPDPNSLTQSYSSVWIEQIGQTVLVKQDGVDALGKQRLYEAKSNLLILLDIFQEKMARVPEKNELKIKIKST